MPPGAGTRGRAGRRRGGRAAPLTQPPGEREDPVATPGQALDRVGLAFARDGRAEGVFEVEQGHGRGAAETGQNAERRVAPNAARRSFGCG